MEINTVELTSYLISPLYNDIQLEKQPIETKLSKEQKDVIKDLRNKNILAQVIGQKALFNAIINEDTLSRLGETPKAKIGEVYVRIEKLMSIGVMKKSNDLWKGILVGEDKHGKMILFFS